MGSPYVGEIRMVGFNFAPVNWAFCNGALMAIDQNETLFTLIGTTYGGDGQQTFGLPDLRSRVPVHIGNSSLIGTLAGVESVTLTAPQLPVHSHAALCNSGAANNANPTGNYWANWSDQQFSDAAPAPSGTLNAQAVGNAGGSQPHDNMVPFLAINFIISLFGIFPST